MAYPFTLDNIASNKTDATPSAVDHAAHHNLLASAMNAVQAELGLIPSADHASIGARLNAGAINLKDYSSLVSGGNWMPALKAAHLTGRPIYVPEGIYDLSGDFDADYNHTPRIIGAGKGRTIFRQQSPSSMWNQQKNAAGSFLSATSRKLNRVTVTADAPAGSTQLTFSTTGYSAGDWVYLRKNILWNPTQSAAVYGEVHRIRSIDSSTQATLAGPIDFDYTTGETTEIMRLSMMPGAYFGHFTLQNPNPESYTVSDISGGLYVKYAPGSVFDHLEFIGMDEPCIAPYWSPKWRALFCDFYDGSNDDANGRFCYGVYDQAGSRNGLMIGCNADNIRHTYTCGAEGVSGGQTNYGPPAAYSQVAFTSATNMKNDSFNQHESGWRIHLFHCRATQTSNQGYYLQSRECIAEHCTYSGTGVAFQFDPGSNRDATGVQRAIDPRVESASTGLWIDTPNAEVIGGYVNNTTGVGASFLTPSQKSGAGPYLAGGTGALLRGTSFKNNETGGGAGTKRAVVVSAERVRIEDITSSGVDRTLYYNTIIDYATAAPSPTGAQVALTGVVERRVRADSTVTVTRVYANSSLPPVFAETEWGGPRGIPNWQVLVTTGSITINPGDPETTYYTGNITAARTVTMSTTGMLPGTRKTIVRSGVSSGGPWTLDVKVAGTTIKSIPDSSWAEFEAVDATTMRVRQTGTL